MSSAATVCLLGFVQQDKHSFRLLQIFPFSSKQTTEHLTYLGQEDLDQPIALFLPFKEKFTPGFPQHVLFSFGHESQGAPATDKVSPHGGVVVVPHVHAQVMWH